jgi:branched-chain amino acid transport system substrate-binding protein
LHYGDGLNIPKNTAFRAAYAKAYATPPDVYAVQGYDAAQLLIVGMNAVKGDTSKRAEMVAAMAAAKLDSPRGPMSLTKSHNPIHDIYLRKVEGKENKVMSVAVKNITDPPRGCKM